MKSNKATDEKDLLVKLRNGDHRAFEKIYHLYKDRLISSCLRLLKSPELTEELLQDLFLKLWLQREKIDVEQSLNAYLYKVAHNMVYDFFRKASRDRRLQEHLIAVTPLSYNDIEEHIYQRENKVELMHAVSLLPPQQQKIFKLCRFEEKSHEEISALLNITVGTVNNHMTRANTFIKEYFQPKPGSHVAIAILAASILANFN